MYSRTMPRVMLILAAASGLAAANAAQAQTYAPTQIAMVTPQPSLELRVEQLTAQNRQLSAQVGELRQQVAVYRAQAAATPQSTVSTNNDGETVYVTSRINPDKRYENWFGLSIGDSWRLQDDTPIKLIRPTESKLSYKILPAGTVVTIIGAPRGVNGVYAVSVNSTTSGWAQLRQP